MVWARWRSRSCRGWWTPHDSPIPAPYCCSASYTETESREREKEGKTGKLVGRREEEEPQVNSRGRDGRREVKQHGKEDHKEEGNGKDMLSKCWKTSTQLRLHTTEIEKLQKLWLPSGMGIVKHKHNLSNI